MKTIRFRAYLLFLSLFLCLNLSPTALATNGTWSFVRQDTYSSAYNLHDSGCGIFALVNAIGFLTGRDMGVETVAAWAEQGNGYSESDGTVGSKLYPNAISKYGEEFGFTGDGDEIWESWNSQKLKDHLLAGGVAVGHTYGTSSNGKGWGHFIAIVEYNSSTNEFHVLDSWPYSQRKTATNGGDVWHTGAEFSSDCSFDRFYLFSPTSYISKCTTYTTHLTLTTTAGTSLMSLPCSSSTDPESTQIAWLSKGETFTAYEVYVNERPGYGICWYKGYRDNTGEAGYLVSTKSKVTKFWNNAIKITASDGYPIPSTIEYGHGYYASWLLRSNRLNIDSIEGCICDSNGNKLTKYSGNSLQTEINDTQYQMGSERGYEAVDSNLLFGALPAGDYSCKIKVKCLFYYGGTDGKLQTQESNVITPVSFNFTKQGSSSSGNTVMTANQFIAYLQHVVDRGDSKYGSGGQYSSGKYDGTNIYFDCWGLGESIIATRGEIVYNTSSSRNPYSLYDTSIIPSGNISGEAVKQRSQLSSDFTNIEPGEWLFYEESGTCTHVGYYIGDGKLIEIYGSGKASIGILYPDGRGSISSPWARHGKVPWIDYSATSGSQGELTPRDAKPCDLQVTTSGTVEVWSLPGNKSTYPESENFDSISGTFHATRIIENNANEPGHFWYEIETPSGETGYIWYKNVSSTSQNWTVNASGVNKPDKLTMTDGHAPEWNFTGTITTGGSIIKEVQGFIYSEATVIGTEIASSDPKYPNSTSFNISGLNDSLSFSTITEPGHYTYVIKVRLRSAAIENGTCKEKSSGGWIVVNDTRSFFTVGELGTEYTVTYNPNGGFCSISSNSYPPNSNVYNMPPTPTFEGYTFSGWYTEPFGGSAVYQGWIITEDTTLYAHWNKNTHKISFNAMGTYYPDDVITHQMNGVDIGRASGYLVLYKNVAENTNQYGVEIAVDAQGRVVNYRPYGNTEQLPIPQGGFRLSGHVNGSSDSADFIDNIHSGGYQYVDVDYATGTVTAYKDYMSYLAGTKQAPIYSTGESFGELPVIHRDGLVFGGWYKWETLEDRVYFSTPIDSYLLYASWDDPDDLSSAVGLYTNDHVYWRFDYNVSWSEAAALCERMGGHLVTVMK